MQRRMASRACWERLGLESYAAFRPADVEAGTIAIAECRFRDDPAMRTALASPETPRVTADVARFTDAPGCRPAGTLTSWQPAQDSQIETRCWRRR